MTAEPTSSDPPEEYETEEVEERTYGDDPGIASEDGRAGAASVDERALVIKDCHPWTTRANEAVLGELGVQFDVITSGSLVDATLDEYAVIVIPSTQSSSYYNRLADEREKLASFVDDGGTLVAHVTDLGWPCAAQWTTSFLPAGVTKVNASANDLSRLDSDHPVVEGIFDDDLDGWNASTHGYLTDLPDDATTVIGISGDERRPSYAEYGYGDGLVLVTMQTLEWPWSAGLGTKDLLRNELAYALDPERDGSASVSASVTTLQFIPGKEENPSQGGDPLNSGLMQVFPEDERWGLPGYLLEANADPVFDSWMGGDMIDELPAKLEDAREKVDAKYFDDVGDDAFRKYRFENGVSVSFETTDDGSIGQGTVAIEFSEVGPSGTDPVISRGEQENSMTVLHDHEINGIPWEEWYDENERRSNRERRYYEYDTEFEFDGVEGVRVVTVGGGWAAFMDDVSHRASDDTPGFLGDIWDWGFARETLLRAAMFFAPSEVDFFVDASVTVPRTWTFVDFIVLADGRRYARVWDASQYPSLYTYVDGDLEAREDMRYEPKQLLNVAMVAFHARAIGGFTPYNAPTRLYDYFLSATRDSTIWGSYESSVGDLLDSIDVGWGAHELMPTIPRVTVGFTADGAPLDDPDEPFPSAEGMFFPGANSLPPN